MKQKKPLYDFQVVSGMFPILSARLSKCGKFATTEPCLYCGNSHRHKITRIDSHDLSDGKVSLGHHQAACAKHGVERELFCGTIVNNDNGYFLVDAENMKLPNRTHEKVTHILDRNIQFLAGFDFWLMNCCIVVDAVVSTSDKLFADFQYCMKKTKLYRHEITEREFVTVLKYAGFISSYENGDYVRNGIVQRDKNCRSIDAWLRKSTYPKIWK